MPVRALGWLLNTGFVQQAMNPLRHLGALTIFFFWIVLISGIWLFIFFRTSVDGAYGSVEYLTHSQWYFGGVMRSLHRYASDAAVITLLLHIVREFSFDNYRGKRWFSWVTGVPLLWMIIPLGITGYWLVWDQLAQYVALASAELIDTLPIFTDSMARNFLSDDALSDRFFTLMAFLHLIGLPLFLVFGIWLHVLRINSPEVNPPRLLMSGSLLVMLLLSLVFPAVSQEQANLAVVPGELAMDWFYLLIYPLIDSWNPAWVWGLLTGISILIFLAPWLPPEKKKAVAVVDLDNCNGCERCVVDCPFGAVSMQPRTDGKAYLTEAVVDPDLCLACGICVGACPTATPFRTRSDLIPGIDLPESSMSELRLKIQVAAENLTGERRIMVFYCEGHDGPKWNSDHQTAAVELTCMGQLPPPFMDYILSRNLADGIILGGCGPEACRYRFGSEWTTQRINRKRDPQLRKRVSADRISMAWMAPGTGYPKPAAYLKAFRATLGPDHVPSTPKAFSIGELGSRAIAFGIFAVVIGVFSVWPGYRPLAPGQAVISLSFSHAGDRVEECRRLNQQELEKLPPNMRKPTECPRERHPVAVSFRLNDSEVYRATISPSGIWKDGESVVYQRIAVEAGQYRISIGLSNTGNSSDFDYELQQSVDLSGGQHIVISFHEDQQEFKIQ